MAGNPRSGRDQQLSSRRRRWRSALVALAVGGCLAVAACGGDSDEAPTPAVLGDDAITVASFDFAESELLAEIYGQALEAGGYHVERALRLGPRELVEPALVSGLIEFVPEYAGTALQFLGLGSVDIQRRGVEAPTRRSSGRWKVPTWSRSSRRRPRTPTPSS